MESCSHSQTLMRTPLPLDFVVITTTPAPGPLTSISDNLISSWSEIDLVGEALERNVQ